MIRLPPMALPLVAAMATALYTRPQGNAPQTNPAPSARAGVEIGRT